MCEDNRHATHYNNSYMSHIMCKNEVGVCEENRKKIYIKVFKN